MCYLKSINNRLMQVHLKIALLRLSFILKIIKIINTFQFKAAAETSRITQDFTEEMVDANLLYDQHHHDRHHVLVHLYHQVLGDS